MSSPGFALDELQKAIFSALSNDSALTDQIGASGRIYDYVPEPAEFPYVAIGENTAKDWDTQTSQGQDSTFVIHTWTQGRGRLAAELIMKQIYRVLHLQKLSMATQGMVLMRQQFATVMLDPDGTTYHGVQRFRILTEGV